MATGMKSWLSMGAVGMALVFVWTLPVPDEAPGRQELPAQTQRHLELQRAVARERAHLVRLDWIDSLNATLGAKKGASAIVRMPGDAMADSVRALEERLAVEIGRGGPPQATFGVFVTKPPPGGSSQHATQEPAHDEYYVGIHEGTPYCFVVRVDPREPSAVFASLRRGGMSFGRPRLGRPSVDLGPCSFVIKYGLPGQLVGQWLKAGSFSRGLDAEDDAGSDAYGRGYASAQYQSTMRNVSLAGQSCLRRDVARCSEIFLSPRTMEAGSIPLHLASVVPELWEGAAGQGYHLQFIENSMLSDLEREFGSERFARFWSSPSAVTEAFQSAFRVEPGLWLQRWGRFHYEEGPSGSDRVEAAAYAALLLLGSLLAVLGTVRRRSVA